MGGREGREVKGMRGNKIGLLEEHERKDKDKNKGNGGPEGDRKVCILFTL